MHKNNPPFSSIEVEMGLNYIFFLFKSGLSAVCAFTRSDQPKLSNNKALYKQAI
jgi:hypothetical protein